MNLKQRKKAIELACAINRYRFLNDYEAMGREAEKFWNSGGEDYPFIVQLLVESARCAGLIADLIRNDSRVGIRMVNVLWYAEQLVRQKVREEMRKRIRLLCSKYPRHDRSSVGKERADYILDWLLEL